VNSNLQRFFTVASDKGVIEGGEVNVMLSSVTLKARCAAACLAIICKSGKGVASQLLSTFAAFAKSDQDTP